MEVGSCRAHFSSEGLLGLSMLMSMKILRKSLRQFSKVIWLIFFSPLRKMAFYKALRCGHCTHTTGDPGVLGAHRTGRPRDPPTPFRIQPALSRASGGPSCVSPSFPAPRPDVSQPRASHQPGSLPPGQAGPGERHCRHHSWLF